MPVHPSHIRRECREADNTTQGTSTSTTSSFLDGLMYSARTAVSQNKVEGSVVVTGMNAGDSTIVNLAVEALHRRGILIVTAAGNDGRGGDLGAPANSPFTITVGATKEDDEMLVISNYGPQVDIFAPGNRIPTTGRASNEEELIVTGTSFAAAHVAGVALYLRQMNPELSPDGVKRLLVEKLSLKDKIKNLPPDTPNKLVFNGGGERVTQ